ncbi:hypothetical protein [Desulfotignum phosphitoxidans]|nr:hypothetical protein [Desulfotignum phosphitoxidans]
MEGTLFPWTMCDFSLMDAIECGIVKLPPGVLDSLSIPVELQTALQALYGHYARTFDAWKQEGIQVPPCFIVVCNNTATSKLVYDYISGFVRENDDGTTAVVNGRLALFRNFDADNRPLARPNTLLIDSEQLESGDALDRNFRTLAADEIDRFKREALKTTLKAEIDADAWATLNSDTSRPFIPGPYPELPALFLTGRALKKASG